jgi:hypothetical protein
MMTAKRGIIGLTVYVIVWDILTARREEQISDGTRRATRKHPVLMRAALIYLGAHCTADLPRTLDVFSGAGWLMKVACRGR